MRSCQQPAYVGRTRYRTKGENLCTRFEKQPTLCERWVWEGARYGAGDSCKKCICARVGTMAKGIRFEEPALLTLSHDPDSGAGSEQRDEEQHTWVGRVPNPRHQVHARGECGDDVMSGWIAFTKEEVPRRKTYSEGVESCAK